MQRFRLADAKPELVAKHLRLATYLHPGRRVWTDMVGVRGRRGENVLGEIWEASDWQKLPRLRPVKIVALVIDGQHTLRWSSRGLFHAEMVGPGDPTEGIRVGTAFVTKDEQLLVR